MKKLAVALSVSIVLTSGLTVTPEVKANNIAQTLCEYTSADDKKTHAHILKDK